MAEYTDQYIDQCFYAWYDNGKTTGKTLLDKLPKSDSGNTPGLMTIKKWADEYNWIARADALDGEISLALDKTVIQKRVEMYEKHADLAGELIDMARDFLSKQVEGGGLKTENAALRALELGIDVERKSVGVSDMVRKIGEMTPDQLDNELRKLLGQKTESEFIIEGETKEEDTEPK